MTSSITRWFRFGSRTIKSRPNERRKPIRRLHVETFEDRVVPSTIQGTVFDDLNGNAVLDPGEPGLAGWTVFLDANTYDPAIPDLGRRNGIVDPGEPVTTTDSNGAYVFDTTNTGWTQDTVGLVLQVDSGGSDRWVNTTATYNAARRSTEPNAIRDFGVALQPFQPIGVAPAGTETRVNQVAAGQQGGDNGDPTNLVSVSADAAGNYVVAWRTVVPGGMDTISARVFNADGSPRTGDITVATLPNSPNLVPVARVALAGDGSRFMISWTTRDADLQVNSTYAQVFRADTGAAVSGRVTVLAGNASTTGGLGGVAADTAGDFAIVYTVVTKSKNGSWSTPVVNAQRYTSSGAANGSAIKVATPSLVGGRQSVAMDGAGNIVVVWDDGSVFAQRFKASGQKNGTAIAVMSGINSNVAMNATGQFVVTVAGMAKRYNANGTPWGVPVTISAAGGKVGTSIDGAGNVTFAWTDAKTASPPGSPPGTAYGYEGAGEVRMQRLSASGTLTPDTIVNATTQGQQFNPGVAATGNGSFVVAWQGYGVADDAGIFAQRYAPVPAPLMAAAPAPNPPSSTLTAADAEPVLAEALRRWQRAGADASTLGNIQILIADLPGNLLGQALGRTITLDSTAAGWGWFVDPTPRSDSEFLLPGDQREQNHMDLLSAIEHELGHLLGYDHDEGGVMAETLSASERHNPRTGSAVEINLTNDVFLWFSPEKDKHGIYVD